jgi:acyl-CoA thioester hydrolase
MSRFEWPARVYWEDTDAGGVVFHANYLRYLERARSEWLRSRGHVQPEIARRDGVLFSVVDLSIRYVKPAQLDDLLVVGCVVTRAGPATMRFHQQIHRDSSQGTLIVDASVRVACVSADGYKPRRLPAAVLKDLEP